MASNQFKIYNKSCHWLDDLVNCSVDWIATDPPYWISYQNNYWDKYEGYDLNRDGIGDIPHHPVNMYSMIIERMPIAVIFLRSFMVNLLDKTEKEIPSITPENFKDNHPMMKPIKLW